MDFEQRERGAMESRGGWWPGGEGFRADFAGARDARPSVSTAGGLGMSPPGQ